MKGIHRLSLAVLVVVSLFAADIAQGQLKPCQPVDTVKGYKVLLDEIRFNQASAPDATLMRMLQFQVESGLDKVDLAQGPGWKLVRCQGRSPEGEQSFSDPLQQSLIDRDVVLEVWGEIFPGSGGADVFMTYAMFPVKPAISPFFKRRYQAKQQDGQELLKSLRMEDLMGYALVTRSVRHLALNGAKGIDQARSDLVTAKGVLQSAFGANPDPRQKQLLTYIDGRNCELLQSARSNPQYAGPLKALPKDQVSRECPGVTP